jgi:hypothetical protein
MCFNNAAMVWTSEGGKRTFSWQGAAKKMSLAICYPQIRVKRFEQACQKFAANSAVVSANLWKAREHDEKLVSVLEKPFLLGSDCPRRSQRISLDLLSRQIPMSCRAIQDHAEGGDNG